ncbi:MULTISPECIES: signal recognition particle protein [Nitrospirillum]|uniref:Signal recognition particle protein n=2 Tax=Nitrospirillum TaxID=1543705 RepID=A0A248JRH2_9PROT|nr:MULTISPECIES: signal recognition particle protein [Nitrospirillum]ASG21297.1 signal recognition particle protein [Nitrospirillum amazonense CBAmc]MDG3442278.1 signal recognition particle protein [Nitrospirillum amazonense]MEA1677077.1 signal recognition particle protein [Nitrospirillum sp. BR 11163]TWB21411.1 signal recognition particle subunit FFH/SRP54 (srp54) [Nitrospirillum amazonense]TWB32962.1 signal recognition particle subunit FFH/SRP54 (srp54) [Nitrospirillum amazonense]
MFDGLTGRLGDIFDRLRRRGALTEEDVGAALREVRVALLEADVALPVVKSFINGVKEKAVGQEVLRSITPGQMVIKIVHDHLVEMLGEQNEGINLNAEAPVPVLMLGLQGSGKTTSTAKIARLLKTREKKKVLMASLDTRRPAAQEQLRVLGEQVDVATLPIVPGEDPVTIAQRAMRVGRLEGYDVVMLDTAGRLAIDEELMDEVVRIRDVTKPVESLLVVDAMTGQDAVTVATNFNDKVGVTGIVMTRIDGDARGGAALSMRQITGRPIKLLGTGEKIDALEAFHPDRIAGRILGMGDVLSLVEKAAETIDREEAEKLAAKMEKGNFDLDDMLSQLRQIRKMGGMGGMLSMLPGVGKIKDQLSKANIDERMLKRQEAIITSMTQKERRDIKILNASRRRRIALGSGTTVADVNRLLKQYQDMADMMRKFKKLGKKGLMRQGLSALMPKGR